MSRRRNDPLRFRLRHAAYWYDSLRRFWLHDWVLDDFKHMRVALDASHGGGRGFDLDD